MQQYILVYMRFSRDLFLYLSKKDGKKEHFFLTVSVLKRKSEIKIYRLGAANLESNLICYLLVHPDNSIILCI